MLPGDLADFVGQTVKLLKIRSARPGESRYTHPAVMVYYQKDGRRFRTLTASKAIVNLPNELQELSLRLPRNVKVVQVEAEKGSYLNLEIQ